MADEPTPDEPTPVKAHPYHWTWHLLPPHRSLCPEGFKPYVPVIALRDAYPADPALLEEHTFYLVSRVDQIGVLESFVAVDSIAVHDADENDGYQLFVAKITNQLRTILNCANYKGRKFNGDIFYLPCHLDPGIAARRLGLEDLGERMLKLTLALENMADNIGTYHTTGGRFSGDYFDGLLELLSAYGIINWHRSTPGTDAKIRAAALALADALAPLASKPV